MVSEAILTEVIKIVRRAHDEILDVYQSDFSIAFKADNTPVTDADKRANEVIVEGLKSLTPTVPIISEEEPIPPYQRRRSWQRYWIVDPLDGTREFSNRSDEFTVNVALVNDGVPILGVVGVPVEGTIYVGDVVAQRASLHVGQQTTPLQPVMDSSKLIRVVQSRFNTSKLNHKILNFLRVEGYEVETISVGSSLKMCLIAQGKADLFIRFGPTHEWDIAAAHAIICAAGGSGIHLLDGAPRVYNTSESTLNPSFFACARDPATWTQLISQSIP